MLLSASAASAQETPRYSEVHAVLAKHCASCHNAKDLKGELNLDSYELLRKGGENGPVLVPGRPADSLLLDLVEHRKKPVMPPPKKGEKLKDAEIALLRRWIEAGAPGPKPGEVLSKPVEVPKIEPRVAPRRAVHALAYEPKSKLLAVAQLGQIELRSAETKAVVRTLTGHSGRVNDLAFSADGALLAAAAGEPGVRGELRLWRVSDGSLVRSLRGHEDAVYAVALSPDGKLLASGSYDRDVILWETETGKPLRTLEGHNEAVFDVAFRPDGKILASVSADRTLKLWDVASGQRRDTLAESTKALHAVAWSPDGKAVAAGGVDNRIRIWSVSADASEGTNPIRTSVFAHEGTILKLAWSADGKTLLSSADDRTVKLFAAADGAQKLVLEAQPDWPAAVSFAQDDRLVAVGRLDGSLAFYETATGKPPVPPKPESSSIEPRGLQRGTGAEFKATGKNLAGLTGVRTSQPKVHARLLRADRNDAAWIGLTAAPDAPPGFVDVFLVGPGGEAGPLKLLIDDLPQVPERETGAAPAPVPLPSSAWGVLSTPADADLFEIEARSGQTLVLDLAARRLGSKAEPVLTLLEPGGKVVASNIDFEGESDPLVTYAVPRDGKYVVRVGDLQMAGSAEHHYRLSMGALPVVTGFFPLTVPANAETELRLVGHNLPAGASVRLKAGGPGETTVALDPERFRYRREFKALVTAAPEPFEVEPNELPAKASPLPAPGGANGRIDRPGDADLFRFEARKGQEWVIETEAARRGSPVDTRIEVLHADGKPVERVLLRAVRDSYITFRPIDANSNGARLWQWEEMDLNQLLYIQGEVVKLFLAPRGPDSQWDFVTLGGRRVCYFDTSPTGHAIDAPAYIVEPHPPGTKLLPNGLPTFTLAYSNDDDGMRKLGSDSRLRFSAPADGAYLVRVADSRGEGGERHAYRLLIREARPDFAAFLEGQNPAIPAGSGRNFTVRIDRIDDFDGPVRVDITGLPPGFSVTTPVIVEAGLFSAQGTVYAAADAAKPANTPPAKLVARALVNGKEVVKELNSFGAFSIAPKPQVRVFLEPVDGAKEIAVVPGQETQALLRVERANLRDRLTFDVENLPFGVIVGDIGLNGVLIPENQTERRIFLQCAPWVAPQTRLVHGRCREVGNPTTVPTPFTVLDPKAKR
jgi:WD40 repeat protein/mono/diheme cytochrome c family protein